MFTKSRRVVALGVSVAVAVSGIAVAGTFDSPNNERVIGKVAPKKLSKKKLKPITLTLGVQNSTDWYNTGAEQKPTRELIQISKNVKINLKKTKLCKKNLANGETHTSVRKKCKKSLIGTGRAVATLPGGSTLAKPFVSVFHGPTRNNLILHTYAPELGAASPVLTQAKIRKAPKKGFGQALDVIVPETAPTLLSKFTAKIKKGTGVAKARCKPKKIKFHRTATYGALGTDTAASSQKCKATRR